MSDAFKRLCDQVTIQHQRLSKVAMVAEDYQIFRVTLEFEGRKCWVPYVVKNGEPIEIESLMRYLLKVVDWIPIPYVNWCSEQGFASNHPQAYEIWMTARKTAAKVQKLLGKSLEAFQLAAESED